MYGEILAILTNLAFAFSFVLARNIEPKASSVFQNTIRSIIPAIIFTLICLFSGILIQVFLLPIQLLALLAGSIFFMVVIGDTSYLQSQKYIGPAKALAITNLSPFITIILATVFLNRPFRINLIISGLLIGLGVVIINLGRKNLLNQTDQDDEIKSNSERLSNGKIIKKNAYLKGTIWAIIAAVSWSLGFVLSDYAFSEVNNILGENLLSTIGALMIRYLFASLVLGIVTLVSEKKKYQSKNLRTWGIMILAAIVGNLMGGFFFAESVRTAGAAFMSLMTTALPLFTIPFSYLINKESISRLGLLGVVLTIIGVIIILF